MTTWHNSPSNFAQTWAGVYGPQFVIAELSATNNMRVTPRAARGLIDNESYLGLLDPSQGQLQLSFSIVADGVNAEGKKQLKFISAVENAEVKIAESSEPGDPSWGSSLDEFEGVWAVDGGGQISIRYGSQIQFGGVPGIRDLLYQGDFIAGHSKIVINFQLVNNGFTGGDSQKARELLFIFPEVLHTSFGIPTEGERFEEIG